MESLKGLITHEEENLDKLYQQEKEGNPDLFLVLPIFVIPKGSDSLQDKKISESLLLYSICVSILTLEDSRLCAIYSCPIFPKV